MKKQKPPESKHFSKKHVMVTRKINLERIVDASNNKINKLISKEVAERIQDAVKRVNNIVFHTTHFMELHILCLFKHNLRKPIIDEESIGNYMKTVCSKSKCGSGGQFKEETLKKLKNLKMFYDKHYLPLFGPNSKDQKVDLKYLAPLLAYEEKDILKNIKNNISMHFINYCKEWVNKKFDLKERKKEVDKMNLSEKDKKTTKTNISIELRIIKEDLLSPLGTNFKSDLCHHEWIDYYRAKLITKSVFNKEDQEKNNINYDIKANTLDYLFSFIYIVDKLRAFGRNLQCFPLRSSFTPKYITIDTTALIKLVGSGSFITKKRKIKDNHFLIWKSFFNLNHKVFKRKDYLFHHMIKTDGVGASILFHRKDVDPYKLPEDPLSSFTEQYVDQIDILNLNNFDIENFNIVGIDPGKDDLIHCTDGENFFRYTANQRRFETKRKYYADINRKQKLETIIEGKNVIQWETELSSFRKCSTNFDEFKAYLSRKLPLYKKLELYYHDPTRRKLRWNTYMNTQRSEDIMLNNFENKFGEPKNTLVCIGDYDQKGYHMKYKEPAKGKGFRKLFRNRGYKVFLVDEFRTSKICHNCHHENKKFMWRKNHKPVRNIQTYRDIIEVNGLLRCNSVNGCGVTWNRDVNACLNIRMIAENSLFGRERPCAFQRTQT